MNKSNIILIGMPGSGKSTIGYKLAKKMDKKFLDTDTIIETSEGRSLQTIIDSDGYMALRQIEENVLLQINHTNHVISTGGSAAYSQDGMLHLKENGIVVFLNVTLPILQKRINDFATRGLAKRPDQSFEDLFSERHTLYLKYAEIIINNSRLSHSEACNKIMRKLGFL